MNKKMMVCALISAVALMWPGAWIVIIANPLLLLIVIIAALYIIVKNGWDAGSHD